MLLLLLVSLALLAGRRGFRWGIKRSKEGKEERKSVVRPGRSHRSHRSHTERGVGCEGQENR